MLGKRLVKPSNSETKGRQLDEIKSHRRLRTYMEMESWDSLEACGSYQEHTWKASSNCVTRIPVFINKYLREFLRMDKVRNEEVWRRTEKLPVVSVKLEEDVGNRLILLSGRQTKAL
ncbi:hypothetical protein RRG08_012326 [Elysia crispata]|uniref:Uncharacterized protein n=1 Tax=Elysia crispata TaxID=231223 RepID=A0AAE1ECR7_9GAST|nr:hypothetical protein RRG08_012326 [Elysia crispata]